MAPFRVELAHGTGVRVKTLKNGVAKDGRCGSSQLTAGATELGLPGAQGG